MSVEVDRAGVKPPSPTRQACCHGEMKLPEESQATPGTRAGQTRLASDQDRV